MSAMRAFIAFTILGAAAAFAPLGRTSRRSAMVMNGVEDLPGVSGPFGFFDPAGFSKGKSEGEIIKYRESELKHGRLAMIAVVGILVGEEVEFGTPLYGDKIVGPAIFQFQEADQLTGFGFAAFIIGLITVIETYNIRFGWETKEQKADRDPKGLTNAQLAPGYVNGDLGFDPLGLKPSDPDAFAEMQTKEINNGRLAMLGAAGMILQEIANGKGILENLGLEQALPKAFDTGNF